MQNVKKKHKGKKMIVVLSDSDYAILKHLANKEKCCCSVSLKRLIHSRLKELRQDMKDTVPSNQLSLFDNGRQITLFDVIGAENEGGDSK